MTYRRASISFGKLIDQKPWTNQSHPLSSSFEAMSIRNNLGPARWVKNPKPNEHGKAHWESGRRPEPDIGVEAKTEVASSGSSQQLQAVAGGGQSAGPSASEPSAKQSTSLILPAQKTALKTAPGLAIGDVFCIVLHSLGTGDPVVSSQHAMRRHLLFLCAFRTSTATWSHTLI